MINVELVKESDDIYVILVDQIPVGEPVNQETGTVIVRWLRASIIELLAVSTITDDIHVYIDSLSYEYDEKNNSH